MSWASDVNLDFDISYGDGPLESSPTWTDITSAARSATIFRGRSAVSDIFTSGTVILDVDNADGEFDPGNTSASNQITLGVPIRVQATYSMTTYDLFRGHVSRVPLNYPEGETGDAVAAIECLENTGKLRSTRLQGVSYSAESADTRVGNILDDAGWPAGDRDLDTAVVDVAAITYTGSAGDLIDDTAEAEQGQFFVAKDGDATFKKRTAFSSVSSAATFNPGSSLGFSDSVQVVWDTDELVNMAEITGADDSAQTSSDSTSIAAHGEQSYESTNETIFNASYALNVADWIVGRHKDVTPRFPAGLRIFPQQDPSNLWPEVLGRELQDVITVVFSPPGGGDDINRLFAVEGIQHEIMAGLWVTTYSLHPLSTFETADYWILGSSDLDTETVLA